MEHLNCILQGFGNLNVQLSGQKRINAEMTVPEVVSSDPYSGEYEYIPTRATQTIEIAGKLAVQNITINPIPQNYGLISWNGSTLTVS